MKKGLLAVILIVAAIGCKKKETFCWKCSDMNKGKIDGKWQSPTYTFYDTCGLTKEEMTTMALAKGKVTDSTQFSTYCEVKK